jgi:uncharacterized membrane protein HdeD (DUF308 family)
MTSIPLPSADQTEILSSGLANNWWLVALRGLAAIVFGVLAFLWPMATMLAMAFVFAAYSLMDGAFNVALASRGMRRKRGRWGWILANGILSMAVAVVVVLWPGLTVLAFVILVAAWALLSGSFHIAVAINLKTTHGRRLMVLGGLLSILWSILLILSPLIGAIVLAWWMGAYSLVFGGALLVLAFQLRQLRDVTRPANLASAGT